MMLDLNEMFDRDDAENDAFHEKHPSRQMDFHVRFSLRNGIWIERFQETETCENVFEDFTGDIDDVLAEFNAFVRKQWDLYKKSRKNERRPQGTGIDNPDCQEFIDHVDIGPGMDLIFKENENMKKKMGGS